MQQEHELYIVRADKVGPLLSACAEVCWGLHNVSVLEVLEEQLGPNAREARSPEELIAYGFYQGVGHVIAALVTGELRPELLPPRHPPQSAPRPERIEEN